MFEDGRQSAKADLSFNKQVTKRATEAVSLREKKREEKLKEKRQALMSGTAGAAIDPMAYTEFSLNNDEQGQQVLHENLAPLAVAMYSQQYEEQLYATRAIRKVLAREHEPPIAAVMDLSPAVIPRLVDFLKQPDESLQFEAAWALTNITSGPPEPTPHVVKAGGIPALVELVRSKNKDVVEQSVWALGNIAGEKSKFRDMVLDCKLIPPLVELILSNPSGSIMLNATWTLANLLRGKPQPSEVFIKQALPVLVQLLRHNDVSVKVDALWALSYVSDGREQLIDEVQRMDGLVPSLMENLLDPEVNYRVLCPAIRTAGNFLTGSNQATDVMLQYRMLEVLYNLIDYRKNNIQKECCWAISNICAGMPEHIQRVLESGLMPKVVRCLQAAAIEVRKEAAWVIINLAEKGSLMQLDAAVQAGCIPPMVEMLQTRLQGQLLTQILLGLTAIYERGQDMVAEGMGPENLYAAQMVESGIEERLLALYDHSPNVRSDAEKLLLSVKQDTTAVDYFSAAAQDGFTALGSGGGNIQL